MLRILSSELKRLRSQLRVCYLSHSWQGHGGDFGCWVSLVRDMLGQTKHSALHIDLIDSNFQQNKISCMRSNDAIHFTREDSTLFQISKG